MNRTSRSPMRHFLWKPQAWAVALILGAAGCAAVKSVEDEVPLRLTRTEDWELDRPSAPSPVPPTAPPLVNEPAFSVVDRLRVGDALTVTIRAATSEQYELVIDENGEIRLPLIAPIRALGLSSTELEKAIQKAYVDQQIYRFVTAHVFVPIRSYFVRGEVRSPGRYPLPAGRVTVLQVIATAGGYTDFARANRITIIRGSEKITVDARDFERNPEKDIVVEANDQIIVDRRWF